MQQLPLGVQLRVSLRFETFQPGENAAALAELRQALATTGHAPLWLYGPRGVGRTHLLQAACAEAGEHGLTTAYLPLAGTPGLEPDWLSGLEQLDVALVDDVGEVAGQPGWERALFGLYNGLAERGARLVCAADAPPAALPFALADLKSRFAASSVHRLLPLREPQLAAALERRAAHRGLELPPETLQYLTRRAPRDFATLCRLLDELDLQALAAQRRLTVPFVREVLERGG